MSTRAVYDTSRSGKVSPSWSVSTVHRMFDRCDRAWAWGGSGARLSFGEEGIEYA